MGASYLGNQDPVPSYNKVFDNLITGKGLALRFNRGAGGALSRGGMKIPTSGKGGQKWGTRLETLKLLLTGEIEPKTSPAFPPARSPAGGTLRPHRSRLDVA